MSLNGSGVASVDSAGQPVVDSTLITAAAHNALTADIATMISTCVMKDGQQTITANIPFNNKKITGLAAATARTDAASIATIQDGTGVYIATVGGTGNAITLTPSPSVTGHATGHRVVFIATAANTGAVTLTVSGLGGKSLLKNAGSNLVTGDILIGSVVEAIYDGTRYMMTNGAANSTQLDSVFRVAGSSDATKLLAFEVDGLTTGTTRTVTVPDRSFTLGITLATEQASTSGTTIDFTSIPAGTRRITIMLADVTRSGTSNILVQLGDAGGIETSGYSNVSSVLTNAAAVVTASSAAGTCTSALPMA